MAVSIEPHAGGRAALHGIFQLIHLALANQIRDRRGVDQNLERRDPALLVGLGNELLRDDAAQAGRQHGAHMRLFVGGKCIHQAIDGRRGAIGVQRPITRIPISAAVTAMLMVSRSRNSPTRMTSGSSRKADSNALEKDCRMHADLALADQAVLAHMHEFDRILDGEDVALFARY